MAMPFVSLLPKTDRGRDVAIVGAMAALTALKLWMVAWHQVMAEGAARYDELLFVELADHIRNGLWLGDYDERTLVKGAVYPLWLAAVSLLSLPLLPAQHVLRALAAFALVMALRPVLPHRGARLTLFVALIFDPSTFDRSTMRVIREGLYPSLTLFALAGLAALVGRPRQTIARTTLISLGLGFAFALFWLTREEGVWFLPTVAIALGYAVVRIARDHGTPRRFAHAGLAVLLPLAIVLAAIGGIAALNRHYYGLACVNELKSPFFEQAYGALTRVNAPYRHITPVTAVAREKIYAASPLFAELRPHLDPVRTTNSAERPPNPSEYFGGMFIWRFRDAVAAAGHSNSLLDARDYYLRLAAEVNAACDNGQLACGPNRASLSPAWHNRYALPLARDAAECLHILISLNWIRVDQRASIGPEAAFPLYARVTNMPIAPVLYESPRAVVRIEILRIVHSIFSVALYPLCLLALVGFVLGAMDDGRRRHLSTVLVLATATLAGIAVRTVLLAYINVASFPAIYGIYSQPTYPLLYLFIALGIALGVRSLSARRVRVPRQ